MGSSPSKEGVSEESDMDGFPQTVQTESHVDRDNQNNNGGDLTPPVACEQDQAMGSRMDDMSRARVTVEESKTKEGISGGQNNSRSRSVLVRDFHDISKLERYFKQHYESDIKSTIRTDRGSMIVEFKSQQVAEKVLRDPPCVEGKAPKLSLSDGTPNDKEKVAKEKDSEQVGSTMSGARGESHIYRDSRSVENISQEIERRWQDTGSTNTMTAVAIPGMLSYINDDKEKSIDKPPIPEARNKSPNAIVEKGKEETKKQSISETDIVLDAVKVEFIQKVHRTEFDHICTSYNVNIMVEAQSLSCKVTFREKAPGEGDVDGACDQFLELYQIVSDKLSKNNILNVLTELPECTIQSLKDALTHAEANECILVKNCLSDDFKIVFYGSEHDVDKAIAEFLRRSRRHPTGSGRDKNTDDASFKRTVGDIEVSVCRGDLTQQKVDVVVNAANNKLEHLGGVALAIREAGGKSIQDESREFVRRHGTLHIGQAMHTGAGNMPCKYVIHTVGPIWDSRGDHATTKTQLRGALTNVLHYACNNLKARSIAIPAISAGIYGVPVDVCAQQLVLATLKFVKSPPVKNTLRHIKFVNIDDNVNRVFVRVFDSSLPSEVTDVQSPETSGDKNCRICFEKAVKPIRMYCCGNVFCSVCIEKAFNSKPVCPTCYKLHGTLKGTQPKGGRMEVREFPRSLPGYPECGLIEIHYHIPNGMQEDCHPNPGRQFKGTDRCAYLPNNGEGRYVLQLLKKAFDNRLIFTVGTSVSSGINDVVTWNDIHHKTSTDHDGSYGYPDPDYLRRVREELAAKGIR